MGVGHPEALNRIALEIELDEHHRFFPNHPAVVPGLDRDNLRRLVFDDAAVGVFDVDFASRQEADVGVHAEIGADRWPHVHRPAETWRVNQSLDARGAGPADLEPDVPDLPALSPAHRRKQRVPGGCGPPRDRVT